APLGPNGLAPRPPPPPPPAAVGAGLYSYLIRSVFVQPYLLSSASIQSIACRFRSVPWRLSPNCVRPLIVALYFSRSRRSTITLIGSSGPGRLGAAPPPPCCAKTDGTLPGRQIEIAIMHALQRMIFGCPPVWRGLRGEQGSAARTWL